MSVTKHKIFRLKLSNDSKFTISKTVEKEINEFLLDPNIVYVNHSITTLLEDIEEYGNQKTICRFLLISLIYKDLNQSTLDVKSTSNKVKTVVHKQIESGGEIAEPQFKTELDKEIQQLIKPIPNNTTAAKIKKG